MDSSLPLGGGTRIPPLLAFARILAWEMLMMLAYSLKLQNIYVKNFNLTCFFKANILHLRCLINS